MNKVIVYKLAFIASLGGFLFGFDTAVISGTISLVTDQFQLDAILQGWYVSSALVGTITGTLIAGILSDKYGRKEMLIVSAILFGISAFGCMISQGFQSLIAYRLIGGIGVGLASILSPLYISEIAPAKIRGSLVSLYQFAITLGILVAYFTNAWFLDISESNGLVDASEGVQKVFVSEVWRIMLGSETIPAFLFLVLLFMIPKSPRWFLSKGKVDKAENILVKIVGEDETKNELQLFNNANKTKVKISSIFKGGFKTALIVGVILAVSTQLCGINAVIYYGPRLLEEAGLQLGDALGGQVIIGIVNVLFTLIAIWKIDQFGRKKLLLFGIFGILISLIAIGILFYLDVNSPYLLIGFILAFVACFAFSFGPVVWVLLSEIYPTNIRGFAMSIATFALWIGATAIGQLVPWLLENLKPYGTFWLFALCTIPSGWIVIKILPETKGKSLEAIEEFWLNKK
ncbi:sugar porter family MFS transporter [Hyunsoonleella pacifica]|uniref:MFS transporter n=1 Tax=Hyunsoonleella pacifica TaxID=1080224 RepID=A0A4Q9FWR3_9FLAO|nr:sugar porter family MFS transporter [Hyunsoonleella pacifica]TBN18955.1 MFS transporter [Hyunsoonleella pacifica]GGD06122.1 MFS transporter [Hyunsoonleella pacifica]